MSKYRHSFSFIISSIIFILIAFFMFILAQNVEKPKKITPKVIKISVITPIVKKTIEKKSIKKEALITPILALAPIVKKITKAKEVKSKKVIDKSKSKKIVTKKIKSKKMVKKKVVEKIKPKKIVKKRIVNKPKPKKIVKKKIVKKPKPKKLVKKRVVKKPKKIVKKIVKKKIVKKRVIKKVKPKKIVKKRDIEPIKPKKIIKKREPMPESDSSINDFQYISYVNREEPIIEEYTPPPVIKQPKRVIIEEYVEPQPRRVVKPAITQEPKVNKSKIKKVFLSKVRGKIIAHKKYPKMALRRHIQGAVKVKFDITHTGDVSNIQFINGKSILQKSVRNAIRSSFPIDIPNNLKSELPIHDIYITIRFNIN